MRLNVIQHAAILSAFALAGCSSGPSSLRIESSRGVIEPALQTAVYRFTDSNTADLYLSDFTPDVLVDRLAAGPAGDPGTILHLHVFLAPKAGRTPIDFTASNCTLTYAVFTGSSVGFYGGGGFMLPSDTLGDTSLSGRLRRATVRLVENQPGFTDRLGSAEVGGDIAAQRDDAFATQISAGLTRLLLQ